MFFHRYKIVFYREKQPLSIFLGSFASARHGKVIEKSSGSYYNKDMEIDEKKELQQWIKQKL